MPAQPITPGAAMFGGRRFWTFAILASIIWALVTYSNGENEKADNAKASQRLDTIATEQTAKAKCTSWLQELHGGPGYKLISLSTVGRSREYRTFAMDAVVQRQERINKRTFQTAERCNVYWDSRDGQDGAWDVRVR